MLKKRDYDEFKAIISEATTTLQAQIFAEMSARIPHQIASKTPVGNFAAVTRSLKSFADYFVENFSQQGEPLFEFYEIEAIVNQLPHPQDGRRDREAALCQLMYSPLQRKLTEALPIGYVMIDSELFASFPPNLKDAEEMKNLNKWYRPDFLLLPSFMAEFVKTKQVKISDNEIIQCGRLKTYQLYGETVIIDAKSGSVFSDYQIGTFFYYFQSPTQQLECRAKGMLFNEREFVLVEFMERRLLRYVRGDLTAPGSLHCIRSFLKPLSLPLYFMVKTACEYYQMAPVPYSAEVPGSATLGVGGFAIVLAVMPQNAAAEEEKSQKLSQANRVLAMGTNDAVSVEEEAGGEEEEAGGEEEVGEEADEEAVPAEAEQMEVKGETSSRSVVAGTIPFYFSRVPKGEKKEETRWTPPPDLPPQVALKVIYKDPSQTLDTDYFRGLDVSRSCPDNVIAPIADSFKRFEEMNHDHNITTLPFSSYLMAEVGEPFSPRKPPARKILRAMLISLSYIHSSGFAHGDARYVNCVLVKTVERGQKRFKLKWIDFLHSGMASGDNFTKDLKLFFESAGLTFPAESVSRYCTNMMTGDWNTQLKSFERNSFLRGLIPDEVKSGK